MKSKKDNYSNDNVTPLFLTLAGRCLLLCFNRAPNLSDHNAPAPARELR